MFLRVETIETKIIRTSSETRVGIKRRGSCIRRDSVVGFKRVRRGATEKRRVEHVRISRVPSTSIFRDRTKSHEINAKNIRPWVPERERHKETVGRDRVKDFLSGKNERKFEDRREFVREVKEIAQRGGDKDLIVRIFSRLDPL